MAYSLQVDGRQIAEYLLNHTDTKSADHIQGVIQIAQSWQEKPTFDNFGDHMNARLQHLLKQMQSDQLQVLKRRFPRRWESIQKEQVNLPIFHAETASKAKQFCDTGELYLVGEDDKRKDDADSEAFAEVLKRGQVWGSLKDADLLTQGMERCFVEIEWDSRSKCARLNPWPQHMVHVVPNPARYWSCDDNYVVAFEMPGDDGLESTNKRYKVFVKVPEYSDTGDVVTWSYAHFLVGSRTIQGADKNKPPETVFYKEAFGGNPDMEIPFVDPANGEPIFPFVLWQKDLFRSQYWLGNEDALTLARQVNSSLTDINWNLHFKAAPVAYWSPTRPDVTSDPPADVTVSPEDIVNGGDWEPAFASPEYDPEISMGTWKDLLKLKAQMEGNSAAAQHVDGREAETGYALKIRNLPAAEYRENMVEIVRPMVLDTINRLIIVHNTYAEESDLPVIKGKVHWEPGAIEPPTDEEAEARNWQLKISKNIFTPVDWRMAETGEDYKTAEAAVRENAELNKELAELGMAGALLDARAAAFGGQKPPMDGKPEDKPEDEPEPEEEE